MICDFGFASFMAHRAGSQPAWAAAAAVRPLRRTKTPSDAQVFMALPAKYSTVTYFEALPRRLLFSTTNSSSWAAIPRPMRAMNWMIAHPVARWKGGACAGVELSPLPFLNWLLTPSLLKRLSHLARVGGSWSSPACSSATLQFVRPVLGARWPF